MTKKVNFNVKPTKEPPAVTPEQWVENQTAEATKRLTLDVPASLHARIKATCAMRGVTIGEEVRKLLEEHFPQLPT